MATVPRVKDVAGVGAVAAVQVATVPRAENVARVGAAATIQMRVTTRQRCHCHHHHCQKQANALHELFVFIGQLKENLFAIFT